MDTASLVRKKIDDKVNLQITNDFLHFYFLKLILIFFLKNRYEVNAGWNGNKIICITFDCDISEDIEKIPDLLELLHDEKIKNSFAIVGQLIKKYPMLVSKIIEEGHEILNHTYSHPENFSELNSNQMKIEIKKFQKLMLDSFNYKVKGFRVPHLMRKYDENLFYILNEENLYDSSYVGHGVTPIDEVIEVALTASPQHPQLTFDLYNFFQFPIFKSSVNKFLKLWKTMLKKENIINIYFDPYKIEISLLRKIIRMGKDRGYHFVRLIDAVNEFKMSAINSKIPELL